MNSREAVAFTAFSYAEKILGDDESKNSKRMLEIANAFVAGMEHGVKLTLMATEIIGKEVQNG